MKPLTISLIQFNISWENKYQNFQSLEEKILQLKETHVIVLPEMFATGFSMNTDLAEDMDGETMQWLREMARKTSKIIVGSLMVLENEKRYNRLIWMLPNGQFYHYDKRHLFAFAKEDQYFNPGAKRLIVQVNGWKINLQVCYDLRFPVWARQTEDPYDILINIANWPTKRIMAWNCLLQARAIENQCFVLGVNRVGQDGKGNDYDGNSVVIDPLGKVLKHAINEEAVLTHTFLKKDIEQPRHQYPFLEDKDGFILKF